MTKYAMAKSMASAFGMNSQGLVPDPHPHEGVQRPFDTTMSTERLDDLGIGSHTPFDEGIKECLLPWSSSS